MFTMGMVYRCIISNQDDETWVCYALLAGTASGKRQEGSGLVFLSPCMVSELASLE